MASAIGLAAAIAAILGFLLALGQRLWVMWRKHCHRKQARQKQAIKEIVIQVLTETNQSKP